MAWDSPAVPRCKSHPLKEVSDFRNEQDIVLQRFGPARIAENFFGFLGEGVFLQRDAEVESFWSFGVFLVFSCVFHGSWFRAGDCSFNHAPKLAYLYCQTFFRSRVHGRETVGVKRQRRLHTQDFTPISASPSLARSVGRSCERRAIRPQCPQTTKPRCSSR
jgi:hypothetical protein